MNGFYTFCDSIPRSIWLMVAFRQPEFQPCWRAIRAMIGVCCAVSAGAQSLTLENFDLVGVTGGIIAGSSWTGQVTRNANTITVGGTARDDNGWAGVGRMIDGTGATHVTIIAQRDPGNVAPSLVVQLEDLNLHTQTFAVSTASFAEGTLTTVSIPITAWTGGFDPAHITGWSIGGGTPPTGMALFRITFDHLSLTGAQPPSPPTITSQPSDRAIGVGTGTIFSVTAAGAAPLRYQWKFAGTPLSGATQSTLSLANVSLAQAGQYQVDVSNDAGFVASRLAQLTVFDARATHALAGGGPGYVAGGTLSVTNTMAFSGPASQLRWQVLLPAGANWTLASSNATTTATTGADLIEWNWSTPPTSPVTFTYIINIPGGTAGDKPLAALVTFGQNGIVGDIAVNPNPLIVPNILARHSADTNGNFQLDLVELTRVIELYNTRNGTIRTGAYDVASSATEDGFTAAPARLNSPMTLARYHSADFNRDGTISLLELTRIIALYNTRAGSLRTGAYHFDTMTEDGFAPGP